MAEILRRVLELLREREAVERWTVDAVTVGDAAILVELVDGDSGATDHDSNSGTPDRAGDPDAPDRVAGLAHRPPGDADAVPTDASDPGELLAPVETDPAALAEPTEGAWLPRAAAIATLNALSAPFVEWRAGDPMAELAPDISTIATVGLFRPAFRKFADVTVRVVERERVAAAAVDAPAGVTVETYRPEQTAAAMADADVVFVTGSTLVYGGIERYIEAAPDAATTVVIGATASLLPDPVFDAGADVLAGVAVDDPVQARRAVAAGACGTDLHDRGVRKGMLLATQPTGIDLPPDS